MRGRAGIKRMVLSICHQTMGQSKVQKKLLTCNLDPNSAVTVDTVEKVILQLLQVLLLTV